MLGVSLVFREDLPDPAYEQQPDGTLKPLTEDQAMWRLVPEIAEQYASADPALAFEWDYEAAANSAGVAF
jgi:hypothetical protein